ncbi:SLAM family member 5-like isoform X1 [Pituophis catenifer annectens]|uniref:SLAM family member 5-like isoform X1 n=1 Tax=Pituophis catenifer annectens TaxID=94852 RepID=UPI003992E3CD
MSHQIILYLCFSILLLEDVEAKVTGILGDSVTFQVKSSLPFKSISWSKIASSKSETIAVVTFGEPCGRLVPDPAYEKRVTISKDCRELQLSHLRKEDTGRFTAVIIPSDAEKVDESFDLQIFRHLLDSEMRVTCTPDAAGNGTWNLNCSTGTWEDGVKFSWTSAVQSKDLPLWNSSILTSQDLNLNVTCAAENPVSKASTTVSLKQVCAEERPGTEAPQVNEKGPSASNALIGAVIAAFIVILLVIVIVFFLCRRKAAKGSGRYTTHAEIENPPRSDSTLIGDQAKETRRKTNQPARRAAKNNQEMPHTIYSAVQHPKQNHLQTDDEKIQKGRRRHHQTQAEKTIYSEITKSQESEDPNIKTIYETVQNPLPVKSSGL